MRLRLAASSLRVAMLALLSIIGTSTGSWAAAAEKVLYSFGSFPGYDGQNPEGGLVSDKAGNLYGTTFEGGDEGSFGTVYELSPSDGGWTETVLYSFCTGCANGSSPIGSLVIDAEGNLYGTTYAGGSGCGGGGGCGTVFELSPGTGTWTEAVLYTFSGSDGAYPIAGLVFDTAGNLYGTTPYGGTSKNCTFGATTGCGVVFELSKNPNGSWTETVLHNFQGHRTDGDSPFARLTLDDDGNVYGTTAGNSPNDRGTVFELARAEDGGWNETVLHHFAGATDGNSPESDVVLDSDGSIYGTTRYGGAGECSAYGYSGCGTVFKLQLSGTTWTESALYSFPGGTDGEDPAGGLVFGPGGSLYGTTAEGGNGCGTVFQLTPRGRHFIENLLHPFECSLLDGGYPLGDLLLDGAGNIYSTTQEGGAYTYGTVFEVTP
ncbi:MAG: choice-of-anchor tandem repeat GloVer-containing protein [Candidatus Sulfotelmatobacter sp.]